MALPEDKVNFHFVEATQHAVDWNLVLGVEVAEWMMFMCSSFSSQMELIFVMMLLGASLASGPLCRVLSDRGMELPPNVYFFGIGLAYSGKSPAFKNFFEKGIREVERENGIHILYRQFTGAGLIDHIVSNQGYGGVVDDEICSGLLTLFGGRNNEFLEIRQCLINFWYGDGYAKVFKGGVKRRVSCSETYMCLGGTAHPDSFCRVMGQILCLRDGLEDRIGVLCAKRRKFKFEKDPMPPSFPDDWLKVMLTSIYRIHREKRVYVLSEDALSIVKELRDSIDEQCDISFMEMEVHQKLFDCVCLFV